MLNQSFDETTLLKLTRKKDILRFKLGRNESEYREKLSRAAHKINSDTFSFNSINSFQRNNREVFKTDSTEEFYALKKISDNIKRLYKINFSNKDDIVNQVLNIISDTASFNIIRLDVKDFFESLALEKIIKKIENDNILSISSLGKLRLLQRALPINYVGVPRGLSISSVLSELFMEDIDYKIKTLNGIYFYARYVDDIIIITHDRNYNIDFFRKIFLDQQLHLNAKSIQLQLNAIGNEETSVGFDFLGYSFLISGKKDINDLRFITVDLSTKKIKKIKTRIIKSIISYQQDKNDVLLKNRIKFLTGNYLVRLSNNNKKMYSDDDNSTLKGGIYYNNKYINTQDKLNELSYFMKKLLFSSKSNFIGNAVQKVPLILRRELSKHSFTAGHTYAILHEFTDEEMDVISKCWR